MIQAHNRKLSVAPMMGWSTRHMRYLWRLLNRNCLLYSEMISCNAILRGQREFLLKYSPEEHPLALQLGGSNPQQLASCARIAEDHGWDEVNLNLGCPSERVQHAAFGAALMLQPQLVAQCITAMRKAINIPLTAKIRLAVNSADSAQGLSDFVKMLQDCGCDAVIVHARRALLQKLNPKENRTIPPLDYPRVYMLKQEFPQLPIIINGGIQSSDAVFKHLSKVDGVMLGRACWRNPYLLAQLANELYSEELVSRAEVLAQMREYAAINVKHGTPLKIIARYLLNLHFGQKGGRKYRRVITQATQQPQMSLDVFDEILAMNAA